ncbi:MAG: carbonate dehydratase [Chthoniobacterales bacterium]|nr:carbonate dehydratase [Chthoniobacterales bacterium]
MSEIQHLIENNRAWSNEMKQREEGFFEKLVAQQFPRYLWIGCSDSRVPANEITGLLPGELFVHRNVANIVYPADLNCLSVLEYAIHTLHISHIIVCGHYGCGGVVAAMQRTSHGFVDNWLNDIRDTYAHRWEEIQNLSTAEERVDRLCEMNVIKQVQSVAHTNVVQNAWASGQSLTIHGWIYGIKDGLVKDLDVKVASLEQVTPAFRHIDLPTASGE